MSTAWRPQRAVEIVAGDGGRQAWAYLDRHPGEPHITFWEGVLAAAVATKEWHAELERHYWTPMHVDGSKLREHLPRERAEMESMLRELGMLKIERR